MAYSYDGVRFFRGLREPFVQMNAPGEHGCNGIQSSCIVTADDEIRIFSCGSKVAHGLAYLARRDGVKDIDALLVHRLRKDGFMYLDSGGNWASFVSKPMVLFDGELTMNAAAEFGAVHYQLTDIASEPIEGFTFDDCQPAAGGDWLRWPLRWRGKAADELVGKIVRLQVRFHFGRIYAFRGNFHFIDAQDWHLIRDGQPIDPSLFDF